MQHAEGGAGRSWGRCSGGLAAAPTRCLLSGMLAAPPSCTPPLLVGRLRWVGNRIDFYWVVDF